MVTVRDANSKVTVAELHVDWIDDDKRAEFLQCVQKLHGYQRPLEVVCDNDA